ncbi:MAG: BadF/BadG/BcrA/BcrD ATPase family protein [Bacteroidota bacterium]|nr:BadF/BadG/BcrA/BcrD ATPase family protein [Bacteroidota bacterium]MDP4233223.1 BadF/BadG/BcrA/BcrD ATPase family protein [Bacteroidota bacterium]MDP4242158.1 BadF/BadG/BcrA/BcrD ATPase family protein [Bacteroidota bacterium]MDP4287808.1 BadF/BadG/BcrA/BcrD ATPase family protein [Bacteroidota bacterium]
MSENRFIYTLGIDVGGSVIKAVLTEYSEDDRGVAQTRVVRRRMEKIRKRNPVPVADDLIKSIADDYGIGLDGVSYIASTGEGEMVERKTGHFYGMTTHARGAHSFCAEARTVVDMGALYARAIKIDSTGRVLDHKMTGQCASGSGQFIENISRYLGLSIEEVGDISLQATNPEQPSGICAVLAETDVINMVSRGIATQNIIKGIHLSVATRIVRLLLSLKAESPIVLTGGLGLNKGMVQAVEELLAKDTKQQYTVLTHPAPIYAGAIGASLWGGYRYFRLGRNGRNGTENRVPTEGVMRG